MFQNLPKFLRYGQLVGMADIRLIKMLTGSITAIWLGCIRVKSSEYGFYLFIYFDPAYFFKNRMYIIKKETTLKTLTGFEKKSIVYYIMICFHILQGMSY